MESGNRREMKKLMSNLLLLVVLCMTLLMVSMAWFAMNSEVSGDGMQTTVKASDYELVTKGNAGTYADILAGLGFSDLGVTADGENSTEEGHSPLVWFMSADANLNNDDTEAADSGIFPGACGVLTFYVLPKRSGTFTIDFHLTLTPYAVSAGGDVVPYVPKENATEEQKNIAAFLNGHMMFFESATEDENGNMKYSKLLTDNMHFRRTFENCTEGELQKVDIYWVWPKLLSQLLLCDDDKNLGGKGNLFENDDLKEYVLEWMTTGPGDFFDGATSERILEIQDTMQNMISGGAYSSEILSELSIYYNRADQKIGEQVAYVLLSLETE